MIELHLDKRVAISPTPITLRVGDQSIQHEEFVLYQNGDYYAIPENAKVMFEGNLYNGQLTSGECEILDRSKGKVKYTFSSGNASVEGAYKRAYLRVYKSDIELVSSENIRIIVLENADLDNGTAEAYENRLEKKLDEFDDKLLEVDSAVTTAKTDIAAKLEDVSIVGESAKTNITKWATETQAIAQTEQAKIQEELPKIQTELSAMNTEVAEAKVKVDELKAGLRLYTAYKMASGEWGTKYPNENLLITKTLSGSSSAVGAKVPIFPVSANGSESSQRIGIENLPDGGIKITSTVADDPYYRPIANIPSDQIGNVGDVFYLSFKYDVKSDNYLRLRLINFTTSNDTTYYSGTGTVNIPMTIKSDNGVFISFDPVSSQGATYTIGDEVTLYDIKFSKGSAIPYTRPPSEATSVLDYQPMRKGIGFLNSTTESDYTWQFTDEYITYLLSNKADKTELNALANRVTALEP